VGNTVEEAKKSILSAIDLYKKYNKKVPSVLKGKYALTFKFDMESLFTYYKGVFTNSALERITGINQR